MNWMFFREMPLTLLAIVTILPVVRPASVVSACALEMSLIMAHVFVRLCRTRVLSIFCTRPTISSWSRWIRCRSEPRPKFSRSRQNSSALRPLSTCRPGLRLSLSKLVGWIAVGKQTGTPPMALITLMKPVKLSWIKLSRWMRVACSMVFHRQLAPPSAKLALSCSTPDCRLWPAKPSGSDGQL